MILDQVFIKGALSMKKIAAVFLVMTLAGLGYFLLKDEVEKTIVEADHVVHPSEDVVNQFGQLRVNGYEWIEKDVHWLDEGAFLFYGRHSTEDAVTYKLDTNDLSLEEYAKDLHRKDVSLLYESHDSIVYIDEEKGSLNVYAHNDNKVLSETTSLTKEAIPSVSRNEEKLAFANEALDKVTVIDIGSGRKKSIDLTEAYEDEEALMTATIFSDDGGFLSIEKDHDHLYENTFSVYGGDSGRVYGQDIIGLSPIFSPDSKTLAFIYSGDMKNGYEHGKIGLFVLKYKKITYLDSLVEGQSIYPYLSWSADSQYLHGLVKTADKTYKLVKIDVLSGKQNAIAFSIGQDIRQIDDMAVIGNKTYIAFNKGNLCVVDNESGRYTLYKGLLPVAEDKYLSVLKDARVLVHFKGQLKILDANTESNVMTYDGELVEVFLSPEETSLCILLSNENQMILQVTTMTK